MQDKCPNICMQELFANLALFLNLFPIRDITDKSQKYFSGHIVALNHEFSIFWTYSGRFAALNQDLGCNLCSGATKCPEKFSVALSVMSLSQHFRKLLAPCL